MGIFNFGRKKEVKMSQPITVPIKEVKMTNESNKKEDYKYQSYGSPLVKIGKGDLTKPYINSIGVGNKDFVYFGMDNRFPMLIDQMYYQSPLHSSIIDFQVNASIGGGGKITTSIKKTAVESVDELTFLKKIKEPKLLRGIALDLKMHKRVHLKVTKMNMEVIKVERISPAKVRYNQDQSVYWISTDWMSYSDVKVYSEYDFVPSEEKSVQIYSYIDLESSPGQEVYPLDRTVSAFNWMYLDGQSANLQKDNIQRSIFGNLVVKIPQKLSQEEFTVLKNSIETKEGDVVPVLMLTADGIENLPIVESYPANENDKAFENLDKRIDDKICQAHTINPSIMGIERPGALGSGTEVKESYPIWIRNVVKPFRKQIEEVMSDVMFLFGIKGKYELEEYDIIDLNETTEKEQEFKITKK